MYRRIYVDKEQRKLQRILWRSDSTQHTKVYELNTVTYGTTAAPYLATRCLRQLGEDNKEQYPTVSRAIISDFYVDDLLTGADSLDEARTLKDELMSILEPAGLSLRKWASNDERVFSIDGSLDGIRAIQGDKDLKTPGLLCNVHSHQLRYSVRILEQHAVTKRSILSLISQIFDPFGLIGLATIRAKIIRQELWEIKLDWNQSLPQQMHTEWMDFKKRLNNLHEISIKTICLPRLELCGALLLAQLSQKVSSSMDMNFDRTFFWCD